MTDFLDATVEIHAETERGILTSQDGDEGNAVWLPLAQIEVGRRRGKVADVSIPQWLAEKVGWA